MGKNQENTTGKVSKAIHKNKVKSLIQFSGKLFLPRVNGNRISLNKYLNYLMNKQYKIILGIHF